MPMNSTDAITARDSGFALGEAAWLEASEGHRIAWWQGGDAHGLPLLLLHGGPGGQTRPEALAAWQGLPLRWVAFDQRGCGRSEPPGETRHNTLDALIADIERLREYVRIERWAVAAGSWGACVALTYLLRHPQRVAGLFLRSPFLGSPAEVERYLAPWPEWLAEAGRSALGGDAQALPRLFQPATGARHGATGPGSDLALTLADEALLAAAWSRFDDAQAQPGGVAGSAARWQVPATAPEPPAAWRIFVHYARQGWFVSRPLLDALHRAPHFIGPLALVHGALDACCDPATSRSLAAWHGGADLTEVSEGGHRMTQPAMAAALRAAAARWASRLA
jgi:proline iminopeptidase